MNPSSIDAMKEGEGPGRRQRRRNAPRKDLAAALVGTDAVDSIQFHCVAVSRLSRVS